MVSKPDGALRMCVDYRALNDCTADVSWPIPNIAETIRRIGSQKPKIFGIMDLTQGYRRNNMIDSQKEYSPEYILSALHIEAYKPSPSQYSKIGMLYNTVVGHYGLERTLKRFKDLKDSWEYQRQHVRYFIGHCPCCQKMYMLKIPIHADGFTTSTYTPMKCLNIDFIGPFPDQGYILVIVDTFTRCVELYHTTDATALSAAECLLKHFGRFEAPHQLRSDNGPHFIANVLREFLHLIGVSHTSLVSLH